MTQQTALSNVEKSQYNKTEVFNSFDLTHEEKMALESFSDDFKNTGAQALFDDVVNQSDAILEKTSDFARKHPRIISKVVQNVNRNPEIVEQLNPEIYQALQERFSMKSDNYYIPPMQVQDPLDPVAALPVAAAVAVVAAATMFVGRGGLRGVV